MENIITPAAVKELRVYFSTHLTLPIKEDIDRGFTIQQVAFRAGVKHVIDYLDNISQQQQNRVNIR